MSQNRDKIRAVKTKIANSVYNDCLPTRLTTGALKEICFQYDKYMNTELENEKSDILKCIKNSIDLINRQSVSTGQGKNILDVENDLEAIRDMGETIAIIYALPYRTNADIDYVGYAYGDIYMQKANNIACNLYSPDDYINKCSTAVLYGNDTTDAQRVWELLMDSLRSYEQYEMFIRGEASGDVGIPLRTMHTKIQHVTDYVNNLGANIHNDVSESFAQTIAQYIHADCKYAKATEIEKIRSIDDLQSQTVMSMELM